MRGGRGLPHPFPAPPGPRGQLSDGHRRARAEGVAFGGGQRHPAEGMGRPDSSSVERGVGRALDVSYDDFIRTTEERHEGPVQTFVQAPRTARSTRARTRASTASGARSLSSRTIWCPAREYECQLSRDPSRKSSRKTTTSSGCRNTRQPLRTVRGAARLCSPRPAATRCSALRQGLDDLSFSRSRSNGGYDPVGPSTSSTWIDALSTTSPPWLRLRRSLFERRWPASTSGKDIRGSTPSSGPPCDGASMFPSGSSATAGSSLAARRCRSRS